jgi:hypothetical protein
MPPSGASHNKAGPDTADRSAPSSQTSGTPFKHWTSAVIDPDDQQPTLPGYWQHQVRALDHRAPFRPAWLPSFRGLRIGPSSTIAAFDNSGNQATMASMGDDVKSNTTDPDLGQRTPSQKPS